MNVDPTTQTFIHMSSEEVDQLRIAVDKVVLEHEWSMVYDEAFKQWCKALGYDGVIYIDPAVASQFPKFAYLSILRHYDMFGV